jgi:hypothetical protein
MRQNLLIKPGPLFGGHANRAAFTASRFSLDGTGVKARLDRRVTSIPLLMVIGKSP